MLTLLSYLWGSSQFWELNPRYWTFVPNLNVHYFIILKTELTGGDSRGSTDRIWKNKYHFKMADKQRTQVCWHNKDKSYRSRFTHARAHCHLILSANLCWERLFFPPLHVPVRTFFPSTQIGRVSRTDALAPLTASVLRRSGVFKKKKMEEHESVDVQSPSRCRPQPGGFLSRPAGFSSS